MLRMTSHNTQVAAESSTPFWDRSMIMVASQKHTGFLKAALQSTLATEHLMRRHSRRR